MWSFDKKKIVFICAQLLKKAADCLATYFIYEIN